MRQFDRVQVEMLPRKLIQESPERPFVAVEDRPVDHGHLFHTILRGVGVDSHGTFHVAGRDHPIADPAKGPIDELLA